MFISSGLRLKGFSMVLLFILGVSNCFSRLSFNYSSLSLVAKKFSFVCFYPRTTGLAITSGFTMSLNLAIRCLASAEESGFSRLILLPAFLVLFFAFIKFVQRLVVLLRQSMTMCSRVLNFLRSLIVLLSVAFVMSPCDWLNWLLRKPYFV